MGDIILGEESNEFHRAVIKSMLVQLKLPLDNIYPKQLSDLKTLKYISFDTDYEVAWVHIEKYNKLYIKELVGVNLKHRHLIVTSDDLGVLGTLETMYKEKEKKYNRLAKFKTYSERYDFFSAKLKGYVFENIGVRRTTLKALVREPEKIDSVLTTLIAWKGLERAFSREDLEAIFIGTDFFNLDDSLLEYLFGTKKRKNIETLDYFINYKGYAPTWIATKLKEFTILVDYMYRANQKGLILTPVSNADFKERASAIKFPIKELPKKHIQEAILLKIGVYSYGNFLKRAKIIFEKNYNDEEELTDLVVNLIGLPSNK